jgi:hypothetical protein
MRLAVVVAVLTSSVVAGTLPDDATLSRLLIGTWQDSRHSTEYRPDGTWIVDPQNYDLLRGQNTHGKWHIKDGKLIETWRFRGESSDSSTVDQIIELTRHTLKFRTLSQDGPGRPEGLVLPSGVYTLKRVKHN